MSVQVPPNGTRGGTMPRLPGPLMGFFNNAVFFVFRGRPIMGMRLLALTTVGARSGALRRSTLAYFAEPGNSLVIVGSAGGAARHPAWIYNLAKHPDKVWVELGNKKIKVRPETLQGEERTRMWQRIVQQSPSYGSYETRTDREIPLVRLIPE